MKARHATRLLVLLAIISLTMHPSPLNAHGDERPMKKGILLVAFGSTIPEAQVSFENIEKSVKKSFPGVPVFWKMCLNAALNQIAFVTL